VLPFGDKQRDHQLLDDPHNCLLGFFYQLLLHLSVRVLLKRSLPRFWSYLRKLSTYSIYSKFSSNDGPDDVVFDGVNFRANSLLYYKIMRKTAYLKEKAVSVEIL
jgi:hypothetical protein